MAGRHSSNQWYYIVICLVAGVLLISYFMAHQSMQTEELPRRSPVTRVPTPEAPPEHPEFRARPSTPSTAKARVPDVPAPAPTPQTTPTPKVPTPTPSPAPNPAAATPSRTEMLKVLDAVRTRYLNQEAPPPLALSEGMVDTSIMKPVDVEPRWTPAVLPATVVDSAEFLQWPSDATSGKADAAYDSQSAEFNRNIWPARVALQVEGQDQSCPEVMRSTVYWRRSSLSIRARSLKLVGPGGRSINNAKVVHFTQEKVVLDWMPAGGAGTYYLYYGASDDYFDFLNVDVQWLTRWQECVSLSRYGVARPLATEYRSAVDSMFPMETVALEPEVANLLDRYPRADFLVFAEDRDRPIRMQTDIPAHWARSCPPGRVFSLEGERNEYRVFQLGVWAGRRALSDVNTLVSSFKGPGVIEAGRIQCITLHSKATHKFMGKPHGPFAVGRGEVLPLWFGIDIPEDAQPGEYAGTVTVFAKDSHAWVVEVKLTVAKGGPVPEHGDHDTWRLSRLRWLESDVGTDTAHVYPPFLPLTTEVRAAANDVHSLDGVVTSTHEIKMTPLGLVRSVAVGSDQILAEPIALTTMVKGKRVSLTENMRVVKSEVTREAPGAVEWMGEGVPDGQPEVAVLVSGIVEFDGAPIISISIIPMEWDSSDQVQLSALQMTLVWSAKHARLATGLGMRGLLEGDRSWSKRDEDWAMGPSVWIGSVGAGLGWATDTCEPWEDPYKHDAITIKLDESKDVRMTINFGDVALSRHGWKHTFALRPTPVKKPDHRHWDFRYYHTGGGFSPGNDDTPDSYYSRIDDLQMVGVKRLNLHDWWSPIFNYPLQYPSSRYAKNLQDLCEAAHERGLFVKAYNSGREWSNLAPEFWAVAEEAVLGKAVMVSDPHLTHQRYPDAWHINHTPDHWGEGWPRVPPGNVGNEHTVKVSIAHRYGNFYIEGLRYMARFYGTDGAYWDGANTPYPHYNIRGGTGYIDPKTGRIESTTPYLAMREACKRTWVMYREVNDNAAIDSHHGTTRLDSTTSGHMLCYPFIDSLWHGEGYNYDWTPEEWLTEISGAPFNEPSEILGGEDHFGRAMVFGIWPRMGWGGVGKTNLKTLWSFLDRFEIKDATAHMWWEDDRPVLVDRVKTLASAWVHPKRGVLIAMATWEEAIPSWTGQNLDVLLHLDRARLGLGEGALMATSILEHSPIDISRPINLDNKLKFGILIHVHTHTQSLLAPELKGSKALDSLDLEPQDKQVVDGVTYVAAINCGSGESYLANSGLEFIAERYFVGGDNGTLTTRVRNSNDVYLFMAERIGDFVYRVPLPGPGKYVVLVFTAELYWSRPDDRVFTLYVGKNSLENIDLVRIAGKGQAVELRVEVDVDVPFVDVRSNSEKNFGKLSAIAVVPAEDKDKLPTQLGLSADAVKILEDGTSEEEPEEKEGVAAQGDGEKDMYSRIHPVDEDAAVFVTIRELTSDDADLFDGGRHGDAEAETDDDTTDVPSDGSEEGESGHDGEGGDDSSSSDDSSGGDDASSSKGSWKKYVAAKKRKDVVWAVNCGGLEYVSADGVLFREDEGFSGGGTGLVKARIAQTKDQSLYQSERWGDTFEYSVDVPNGDYRVVLYFAELVKKLKEGDRVFHVDVSNRGGWKRYAKVDIIARVGGRRRPYVITVPVEVTKGSIKVRFQSIKEMAKLSAIKVMAGSAQDDDGDAAPAPGGEDNVGAATKAAGNTLRKPKEQ